MNDDDDAIIHTRRLIAQRRVTADDGARLLAILAEREAAPLVALIDDYWADEDRAARTPPQVMMLHLGLLVAVAKRCLRRPPLTTTQKHPARDDVAIDPDGQILPMTPDAVRAYVLSMLEDGDILAVVIRSNETGDVGVQVFGPPSQEVADILAAAARGFRQALQRARGATH
jgi:hypothetical protein